MKIDNSPARGMRDLLPADVAVRDHVLESISAVYRRFGYQRIETPALEHIDRLSSGEGGDNEKLIFEVLRRGLPPEVPAGTPLRELVDLGLRYDLTVPLTRFYGNNHASLPMPFRSLQVGPVWRADRPQRGRYRQFYQCDIDMIGEPSVLAEAELIEATTEALAAIGLTGLTVRLSDRRFLAALAADCGVPADRQDAFFITVPKGLAVYVPRQTVWPVRFLAEVPTTSDAKPFVEFLIFTRASAHSRWQVVYDTGFTWAARSKIAPDPGVFDTEGYDLVPAGEIPADDAVPDLARYWQAWRDEKYPPAAVPPFAPVPA